MLNIFFKKTHSFLTRASNRLGRGKLNPLFEGIIKNNLNLEKNSEDLAAISEHQILRFKLAEIIKTSSTPQLLLLAKNYAYPLKQFTAPTQQDIDLLAEEFFFKTLNLFDSKHNAKKFCKNLLIATLYHQPWELNIEKIFAQVCSFLEKKSAND